MLTFFIHRKDPVVIVRWFLEPKGLVLFANGPFIEIPLAEFRATGYEWVRGFVKEYAIVRVAEEKLVKVFQPGEARKFMRERKAIEIHVTREGTLIFSPMVIEKYSLVHLRRVSKESELTIPLNSPPDVFWKTFDEVLALAPPDE